MPKTFSVSEVAQTSGVNPRTIQFWADKGVIRATPSTSEAGKGTHRSFSYDELLIACLMNSFSGTQVRAVGELKTIAKAIRTILKGPDRVHFEAAVTDSANCFLILIWLGEKGLETMITSSKEGTAEVASVLSDLRETPGRAEIICLNKWIGGVHA
jgi:DNA-binding transcriptional MerR regulator